MRVLTAALIATLVGATPILGAAEVVCWKKSVSQRGADLYTLPDVPGITFRLERIGGDTVKLGLQMKGVAEFADHVHVQTGTRGSAGVIANQQVSRTATIPVAGAFFDSGKLLLIYKGLPGSSEAPRYMLINQNGTSVCHEGTGGELGAAQRSFQGAEMKEVKIPAPNLLEQALGL